MCEEDVQRVLKYPATMIGSDGLPHDAHPHPRLWGTFPRVLGHYSRELGLFSLETAVHKMSGLSARNFKLEDRGEIREGAYADLLGQLAVGQLDAVLADAPVPANLARVLEARVLSESGMTFLAARPLAASGPELSAALFRPRLRPATLLAAAGIFDSDAYRRYRG